MPLIQRVIYTCYPFHKLQIIYSEEESVIKNSLISWGFQNVTAALLWIDSNERATFHLLPGWEWFRSWFSQLEFPGFNPSFCWALGVCWGRREVATEWWEALQRSQNCSGGTAMSLPPCCSTAWGPCLAPLLHPRLCSALGLTTAAGTSGSSVILLPLTPGIFSDFMSAPGQPHLLPFLISNIPVAT